MAEYGWRRPQRTRPSRRREVMLDLPHNSIKAMGGRAGASLTTAATRAQAGRWWLHGHRKLGRLAADVSGLKGREAKYGTLGANPAVFIGGDGREKGNRPPRSPGLPRAPPRHVVGHAPTVPILSPQKSRRTVRLPQANPDSLPTGETQATKACSFLFGPPRAQKLAGRPN